MKVVVNWWMFIFEGVFTIIGSSFGALSQLILHIPVLLIGILLLCRII